MNSDFADGEASISTHEDRTWRAAESATAWPVELLIEVPHGATTAEHYEDVRSQLKGPLPEDLSAFFFVNTDVGAPEAAAILAEQLTSESDNGPALASVRVLRGLVPRTFADFNRVVASERELRTAGFNPAIPEYIQDEEDRKLLSALHRSYDEGARQAHDNVCGSGGFSLILHSYAPRSVGVTVDRDIVKSLRQAYEPSTYSRWPMRPVVEIISETPDGQTLPDRRLVEEAKRRYAARGLELAENVTYQLHPATSGTRHAMRWQVRTLCVELNRAHLVPEFVPFVELEADRQAIADLVSPLAESLRKHLASEFHSERQPL